MAQLLKRLTFMVVILAASAWGIASLLIWNPATVDPFYRRFTTPPASSMILGTSRAAQGLRPSAFDASNTEYAPLFNFAFTIAHSPYGEAYLRLAKKKTDCLDSCLFALEISPWAVSYRGSGPLRETNRPISEMVFVNNMSPNLEYLLRTADPSPSQYLWRQWLSDGSETMYLHENGWLEVRVDEPASQQKINRKIAAYEENAETWHDSPQRWHYLQQTIETFSQKGRVVLVRVPVSPEMKAVEDQYMPNFDNRVTQLSDSLGVDYFSFISQSGQYRTTDGNHIWYPDTFALSTAIADSIRSTSGR